MVTVDMEMPESCMYCPLLDDMCQCAITRKEVDIEEYSTKRLEDCPIQEREVRT